MVRAELDERLRELGIYSDFYYRKELKALCGLLSEGERLDCLFTGVNEADRKMVAVTDSRILIIFHLDIPVFFLFSSMDLSLFLSVRLLLSSFMQMDLSMHIVHDGSGNHCQVIVEKSFLQKNLHIAWQFRNPGPRMPSVARKCSAAG